MSNLWNLGSVRDSLRRVRQGIARRAQPPGKRATRSSGVREFQLALTGNGVSFSFPPPSHNLPCSPTASPREADLGSTSCLCWFLPLRCDGSIAVPFPLTSPAGPPFLFPSCLLFPILCRALQPLARGVSS